MHEALIWQLFYVLSNHQNTGGSNFLASMQVKKKTPFA
jgi:hypothetical protein